MAPVDRAQKTLQIKIELTTSYSQRRGMLELYSLLIAQRIGGAL